MSRLLCSVAVCVLAIEQAIAAPKIEPLRESELDATQFCRFFAIGAGRSVILQMKHGEANMRLDDSFVRMSVKEKNCFRNCVSPGRSGVRVFQLSAPGVTATLSKKVTCGKDAETCGGLEEGKAELAVSTAAGHAVRSVWGEYCDL